MKNKNVIWNIFLKNSKLISIQKDSKNYNKERLIIEEDHILYYINDNNEENEILKMRLRGAENIISSSHNERSKFMEGASWVAKKAHLHTEKHIRKV